MIPHCHNIPKKYLLQRLSLSSFGIRSRFIMFPVKKALDKSIRRPPNELINMLQHYCHLPTQNSTPIIHDDSRDCYKEIGITAKHHALKPPSQPCHIIKSSRQTKMITLLGEECILLKHYDENHSNLHLSQNSVTDCERTITGCLRQTVCSKTLHGTFVLIKEGGYLKRRAQARKRRV